MTEEDSKPIQFTCGKCKRIVSEPKGRLMCPICDADELNKEAKK